jgi:hypothetical protein
MDNKLVVQKYTKIETAFATIIVSPAGMLRLEGKEEIIGFATKKEGGYYLVSIGGIDVSITKPLSKSVINAVTQAVSRGADLSAISMFTEVI